MAGGEEAPRQHAAHVYALPAGTLLHEFRIDALLGHGGFGITYRAFDTSLHKAVAIKEYLPNDLAARVSDSTVQAKSEDDQQQFEQGVAAFLDEARLVARVRHRNIMEVLRFFKLNGTGYIVLGYEQGRTLKQRLEDGPLTESELRHLLGGLLDGIEALHAEAILHRDLKPSNIILSDSRVPGERAVPVLIDFGAARDFRSRHSRSVTTIVAPGYAPPEQYGIGGQPGPWSDLYALGATAYRCATGEAPPEALRRLRKDPYVPAVTAAAGRYDAGLLALIDRMLSVEEADRPQSAGEVKAALSSRGVLRSRPKPIPTRDGRPAAPSRSRLLAGFIGGVIAVAFGAFGAVLWLDGTIPKLLGDVSSKPASEAKVEKIAAAPASDKAAIPPPTVAAKPMADVAPKAADVTAAPSSPAIVATPTAAAAPISASPPPVVKRSLVDAVAAGFEPVADRGDIKSVTSVAFSLDGRTLASGSYGSTIKLWDAASGRELRTLTGYGKLAFSPDGRTLASGSGDKTIKLWDVASGRELRMLTGHGDDVYSVAFSPDGRTLASGSTHNMIKLWDVASGRELRTIHWSPIVDFGLPNPVGSVAFSPRGRTLVSGSGDITTKLWDVTSGRELRTYIEDTRSVAFSPDGRIVASGGSSTTIKLWDVASGRELRTLKGHGDLVASIAFSPDGRTLASGSWDKTVKLWDVASGRELRTLTGHSGHVNSVAFSPDGRTLASGSDDGTIILWSVAVGTIQARYLGKGTLGSIALDGKGLPMSVSGNENEIYHFVKDGKVITVKEMRAMGYDLPAPGPE